MRACALVRVATSAGRHRLPVEFNEGHTREQFLRFFVSMFQKYRAHMARPCDMTRNSEPDEIFNREAFIRDQPESARVLVFFFLRAVIFSRAVLLTRILPCSHHACAPRCR